MIAYRGDQQMEGAANAIVGRDAELATIESFLQDLLTGPRALLVEGEAGIGKTTLWRAAISAATDRGYTVLPSKPVEIETKLLFTGLGDLLEQHVEEVLPALPEPQRRALEIALLRADAAGSPPDQRAVSLAVLSALRVLASSRPLLVAVDDVQWLDPSSASVLAFAVRRIDRLPVGVAVSLRLAPGLADPLGLDEAFPETRIQHISVAPLGVEALGRIFTERLKAELPPPLVHRLQEVSGGNPFFAIEIARALERQGERPRPGEPIPVPATLEELLRARLARLSDAAREALLVASAAARPTIALVEGALRRTIGSSLREARDAGILDQGGNELRFSHPLLQAEIYAETSEDRRRETHVTLAAVVADPEERARHLALATTGPDPLVAAALDDASARAAGRGALVAAAELSELACRLTPPSELGPLSRRRLQASQHYFEAGDPPRARALLEQALGERLHGPRRSHVLNALANEHWNNVRSIIGLLEQAIAEAGDVPVMLSWSHLNMSWARMYAGDIAAARHHADLSLRWAVEVSAEEASQWNAPFPELRLRRLGHAASALMDALSGRDAAEHLARVLSMDSPAGVGETGGLAYVGTIRMWSGEFDEARRAIEEELQRYEALGRDALRWELLGLLAELESRAGNWALADQHAEEAYDIAVSAGLEDARPEVLFYRALVRGLRGDVDDARRLSAEGLQLAESMEDRYTATQHRSLLGFVELSLGNAASAHGYLGPLPAELDEMGIGEPGAFPLVWDDVEALMALGRFAEAEPIVARLAERAASLDRAWIQGLAARTSALLAAGAGDLEAALGATERSLAFLSRTTDPFDHARALLLQGEIHRRAKRKRAARDSLAAALWIFEDLGARLWADRARAELGRVGARAVGPTALTPTEQRVAELAGKGKTNRQIADELFVSPKTVEANMSRVLHKLGVSSRRELVDILDRSSAGNA